jgi:hypothetical protein
MKRMFFAAVVSVVSSVAALAQEVCVVCSGPDASYRCTVEKAEKIGRFGNVGDKALQLVCAKELARQGGHDKCSARRDGGADACTGALTTLPLASLIEAAQAPPPAPVIAAVPVDPAKAVDPKSEPPRTVLELAQRTGETSKKQLKTVGTAAERTWTCLSSLFQQC